MSTLYIILSKKEEQVIKNKKMLTDISIDACQTILRKQFNVLFGLQDTSLGQILMSKNRMEICENFPQKQFLLDHCEQYKLSKKNETNYYDS